MGIHKGNCWVTTVTRKACCLSLAGRGNRRI